MFFLVGLFGIFFVFFDFFCFDLEKMFDVLVM